MAQAAQRLPGVCFESVPPALEAALPRMDIGMLVGFAASGPLHTPVAIESGQQFRDIFGPDLTLAWNAERGEWQYSQLGASVESFLRNGGKRCWAVRVADESQARTAGYLVPRLVRTRVGVIEDATAIARCAGSWADQLRLRAILGVRQLRMNPSAVTRPAWQVADDGWSVSVSAAPEEFQRGELISLEIGGVAASPNTLDRALLVVDAVQPTAQGTLLRGQRGYWVLDDEPASVAAVDADIRPLSESSALGLEQDALSRAPGTTTAIGRLRLELQAWTAQTLTHRIRDLGFVPEHPRFWGLLPSDEVLYRSMLPDAESLDLPATLLEETLSPRFPFAAEPGAATSAWDFLPIAMPVQIDQAAPAEPHIDPGSTRRQRDGLERFDADHFLDRDLAWFGADMLLREALARTYLATSPRPLRGVHNALLVDEATMLAVPDALHREWDARLPPFAEPLPAPHLLVPLSTSDDGWFELGWTRSAGALSYTIEIDDEPSFPDPERRHVGGEVLRLAGEVSELLVDPATDTAIQVDREGTYFVRVRAEKSGVVSAWSNSRVLVVPPGAFFDCENPSPETLQLELAIDASPSSPAVASPSDSPALVWHFSTGDAPDVDRYEVEEAATLTFAGDNELHEVTAPLLSIDRPMPTARFYRVRAIAGTTTGPWSNTRVLPAGLVSDVTLVAPEDYVAEDLLAVQRSVARICHARGDLFAVLSAPEHYRTADVIEHSSVLTGVEPSPSAGFSIVQPLSSGEHRALSHVGMFYPWLINRGESSGTGIVDNRRLSPEGSVMGMIARRTLAFGPWMAPANEPLVDTLAVTNDAAADSVPELSAARVNVILQTPSAFLTLNEATMSRESEWLTIHVRRLMHMLRRLVLREGNRFVFEPNSGPFRDRVRRYFAGVLTDLFTRGALAGRTAEEAFRVVIDDSVNDEATIARGRLIVELHVAPSAALKFIKVRLVQTGPSQIDVQELSQ
jgi:hypothetical protein